MATAVIRFPSMSDVWGGWLVFFLKRTPLFSLAPASPLLLFPSRQEGAARLTVAVGSIPALWLPSQHRYIRMPWCLLIPSLRDKAGLVFSDTHLSFSEEAKGSCSCSELQVTHLKGRSTQPEVTSKNIDFLQVSQDRCKVCGVFVFRTLSHLQ